MAPPNDRSRRAGGRPGLDEIMEINTGDVMPLVDEDLIEVLHDDAPPVRAASSPTMMPVSDRSVSKPSKSGGPTVDRKPIRRAKSAIEEPQETAVMQSLPAREAAIADKGFSNAFVYVDKGPGAGQLVPILQGEMIIGRSTESGLQLNHPSVSRSHATLIRRGESFFIRDNGSQNGTFVNWAKLKGEAEVFPGDQISVGTAVVLVRGGVYNSAKRRLPGGPAAQARPADFSDAPRRSSSKKGTPKVVPIIVAVGVAAGVALAIVYLSNRGERPEVAGKAALEAKADPKVTETKLVDAPKVEEKAPVALADTKLENKLAVADKPAVAPAPPAAAEDLKRGSRHSASHVSSRATAKAAAEAAPPAPGGPGQAPQAALKLYEAGNIDGAISTAESAGATAAATRMVAFKTAYEAGKAAKANKDGGGAVTNLSKALKLDEQIDQGWGKLNGDIRGQLADLYLLAGSQAEGRGDNATAIKAYKTAQGFQPANAEARKKLAALGGAAKKPAASANPRSAADAAFDN